jgi:hypothetical protein
MSRGYTSELVIDPVIGSTFREAGNGIRHEATDLPSEDVPSSSFPLDTVTCLSGRSLRSSVAPGKTGSSGDDQESAQAANKPNTNKPMASSIRRNKSKARLDGSVATSPVINSNGSKQRDSGKTSGKNDGGKNDVVKNGSKQSVVRGKENISTTLDIRKSSTNNLNRTSHHKDRSASSHKRGSKMPAESGDLEVESPSLLRQPFDWGFQRYYNIPRWEYRMYFSLAWVLVVGLILYQWAGSGFLFTKRPPFYTHPMEAPSNYQEVADRVHLLEKELSSLDSRIGQRMDSETSKLMAGLATLSTAASNAASKSEVKDATAALNKLMNEFFNLQKTTQQYMKDTNKKLNGQMTQKERRDEIQRAVQSALPPQLVAIIKQDGSVELTHEFRKTIEDIFNEFFLKNQQMQGASADGVKAVPSWELFLETNRERLRSTIDERVDEVSKGQAVLNKETVMMMVREQMEHLQSKWEKETLAPLVDRRLSSFQDSFERQQSIAFATMVQTAVASANSAATLTASQVARSYSSSTGKSSSPLAAVGIQVPDFANQLTGAAVWPYLTSASYSPPPIKGNGIFRLIDSFQSSNYVPPPGIAILPSLDVGDCWPFAGSHGTIAIRLSDSIYPTHVTIEHVRKELTTDISVAPKTIEFWVRLTNQTENALVEQTALRIANATGQESIESRSLIPGPVVLGKQTPVDPKAEPFVKLHTFTYDIDGDAVQSFELPVDMTNLDVAVKVVALVIRTNHGSQTQTCLYRTKVHGFPSKPKEQNSDAQPASQSKGWWGIWT